MLGLRRLVELQKRWDIKKDKNKPVSSVKNVTLREQNKVKEK